MIEDWSYFPNFKKSEFVCTHCGECDMHPAMLEILQEMRDKIKRPIYISSGYRCPNHPVEKAKPKSGEHSKGMAADIACYGETTWNLLCIAQSLGVKRIGLHQKGDIRDRFMHLGIADRFTKDFTAAIWTY